jgi:hypothetical protein
MAKFIGSAVLTAGFVLGLQGNSMAGLTTILDQIGPNSSSLVSRVADNSQIFGSPYTQDNLAVVDNFSISTAGTTLTEVDAAVLGSASFVAGDYADVTKWRVEIFSTVAVAASSLTGDVYSKDVAPSMVTLTTPFGTDPLSALVQISVNVTLGVGTYELAVIPVLNYTDTNGAKIGVYASTYAGNDTAVQVNPGGGFGYTNNENALNANAAYRIIGNVPAVVPEPTSVVILSIGLALASYGARRARTSRVGSPWGTGPSRSALVANVAFRQRSA